MTTITKLGQRIECGPAFVRAFKDAMNSLGVRALSVNDDGSENWDLIEINAAIERVGLDGWVKLCRYYQDRHERGLDI